METTNLLKLVTNSVTRKPTNNHHVSPADKPSATSDILTCTMQLESFTDFTYTLRSHCPWRFVVHPAGSRLADKVVEPGMHPYHRTEIRYEVKHEQVKIPKFMISQLIATKPYPVLCTKCDNMHPHASR